MSIELCILGSGSSGNASVVRTAAGAFLIDCGIGPRTAANRLKGTGVGVGNLAAVCVTHLDRDHFNLNWLPVLRRQRGRLICAERHFGTLREIAGEALDGVVIEMFAADPFGVVPGVTATPCSVAHDAAGSFAFRFDSDGGSLGFATDLGHVPASLLEAFCGVDLLAIESNYDPDLQRTSDRPWFLQQRITGGRGHLSNQQALTAVKMLFERCQRAGQSAPAHVVLLHRSQQCNCPDLLRELFSRDARLAGRLVLAEPYTRTEWLRCGIRPLVGTQLTLGWG